MSVVTSKFIGFLVFSERLSQGRLGSMRRRITYFDIHAAFSITFDQSTQPCRKSFIKVAKIGNMEIWRKMLEKDIDVH